MDVAVLPRPKPEHVRPSVARVDVIVASVLSYAADDAEVMLELTPMRARIDEVWLKALLVELVAWRIDCGATEVAVGVRLERDRLEVGVCDDGNRLSLPDSVGVIADRLRASVGIRAHDSEDVGVFAVVPRAA